jgi:hypothetical protein
MISGVSTSIGGLSLFFTAEIIYVAFFSKKLWGAMVPRGVNQQSQSWHGLLWAFLTAFGYVRGLSPAQQPRSTGGQEQRHHAGVTEITALWVTMMYAACGQRDHVRPPVGAEGISCGAPHGSLARTGAALQQLG